MEKLLKVICLFLIATILVGCAALIPFIPAMEEVAEEIVEAEIHLHVDKEANQAKADVELNVKA